MLKLIKPSYHFMLLYGCASSLSAQDNTTCMLSARDYALRPAIKICSLSRTINPLLTTCEVKMAGYNKWPLSFLLVYETRPRLGP